MDILVSRFAKESFYTKLAALVFAFICYVLLIEFSPTIPSRHELFLICTIYSGFMFLFFVMILGDLLKMNVHNTLTMVWDFYAVCAYLAVALNLTFNYSYLKMYHQLEVNFDGKLYLGDCALVASGMSYCNCIIILMDMYFKNIEIKKEAKLKLQEAKPKETQHLD